MDKVARLPTGDRAALFGETGAGRGVRFMLNGTRLRTLLELFEWWAGWESYSGRSGPLRKRLSI